MEKELKIMTATVSIQLITVDGKKMTKAVFNQIQEENCFDTNFNFVGDSFLGYVFDGCKYIIYIKNGELRKHSLSRIIDVSEQILENLNYTREFYKCINKDYDGDYWATYKRTKDEIDLFEKSKKNAISFMQKLLNSQLYIAI